MSDSGDALDFLDAAYQAVFRRPPDATGLKGYAGAMQRGMTPTAVLRSFLESEEFLQKGCASPDRYSAAADPVLSGFRSPESTALAAELQSLGDLNAGRFESLHQEACKRAHAPGLEYPADHLQFHKRRFAELLNACTHLLKDCPHARLLDIGNTQNTCWYKALLPHIELVTADRPGGPSYADSDHHVAVDLNRGDLSALADAGPFDLVVFTEVLEHLSVNPVAVLAQLFGLLNDSGFLYLTTPNFFRSDNLRRIGLHENPQPVYPLDNSDHHHHVREYAMKELLQFVVEAGGALRAWYFSDCWDEVPRPEEERANLVVLASRPVSPRAR